MAEVTVNFPKNKKSPSTKQGPLTPDSSKEFKIFWIVLLFPWILDLLGGEGALASVFGALLWGVAVALAAARLKTRDLRFRKLQSIALTAVLALWFLYWLFVLFGPETQGAPVGSTESSFRWLVLTHAGLLAAGGGIVLVWWLASVLWLLQDSLLRRSSWDRRHLSFLKLPSIEALGKVANGAVNLAFAFWGLGLFLAIINGILKWQNPPDAAMNKASHWGWFFDPKVFTAAGLWLVLVLGFQLGHFVSHTNRWLFRVYLFLASFFLMAFLYWLAWGPFSTWHEPVGWFAK